MTVSSYKLQNFLLHLLYKKRHIFGCFFFYLKFSASNVQTNPQKCQNPVFVHQFVTHFRFHCSKHMMFKSQSRKIDSYTAKMTTEILYASNSMVWNCLKGCLSEPRRAVRSARSNQLAEPEVRTKQIEVAFSYYSVQMATGRTWQRCSYFRFLRFSIFRMRIWMCLTHRHINKD